MIRIRTGYNDIHLNIYASDVHNPGGAIPTEIRGELIVTDTETKITISNLFDYDFRNNSLTNNRSHYIILDWHFIKLSTREMMLHISYLEENILGTYDSYEMIGRILLVRSPHFLNLPYYELPLNEKVKLR